MPREESKIKLIEGALALGFDLTASIQRALGCTLSEFARDNGFTVQAVSMCMRAYEGRVYAPIRDAICADLEIPREYLDRLIDSQRAARAAEAEVA